MNQMKEAQLYDLDFDTDEGKAILKRLNLTEKQAIECQLASLALLCSTDIASRMAHATPSDEFVEIIASATLSGMLSKMLGATDGIREQILEVFHMPCVLRHILYRMMELKIIDVERLKEPMEKLNGELERVAAMHGAGHSRHVH